jgi:hypothetical protein
MKPKGRNHHDPVPWMHRTSGQSIWQMHRSRTPVERGELVLRWGVGNNSEPISVVAMFRRPAQRLLSVIHYRRSANLHWMSQFSTHADWGTSAQTNAAARRANSSRELARLAAHTTSGLSGCQTKMILGIRCEVPQPEGALEKSLPAALAFVRSGLAFGGLVEEWDTSICLWHARFGGTLRRIELLNSRPTAQLQSEPKRGGPSAAPLLADSGAGRYDESSLEDFVDVADEALYATVAARFREEVARWAPAVDACRRRVQEHRQRVAVFMSHARASSSKAKRT